MVTPRKPIYCSDEELVERGAAHKDSMDQLIALSDQGGKELESLFEEDRS